MRLDDAGVICARVSDHDKAVTALERVVEQRCFWMAQARIDPLLDGLRADRRFEEMLRHLNLPMDKPQK